METTYCYSEIRLVLSGNRFRLLIGLALLLLAAGCKQKELEPSEEKIVNTLFAEASYNGITHRAVMGESSATGNTYFHRNFGSPIFCVFEITHQDSDLDVPVSLSFGIAKLDTREDIGVMEQLRYIVQPGTFHISFITPPINNDNNLAMFNFSHPTKGLFSSDFTINIFPYLGKLEIESVEEVEIDGKFYIEAEVSYEATLFNSSPSLPGPYETMTIANGKGRFTFGGL